MKVTTTYEWNEVVWENLKIGDSVELPEFTVPETTVEGANELHFNEQVIKDTATVYDIKDNKLYLVFDHALFKSAVDNNNEKNWKNTQLCHYLEKHFKPAMNKAGIPAKKVSLLSKNKLFGDNPLSFFKNGKNKVAFDKAEGCTRWYWLKTPFEGASAAFFCFAYDNGYSGCTDASLANTFVRPCFVISKEGQ